jgi:hypothetical protein
MDLWQLLLKFLAVKRLSDRKKVVIDLSMTLKISYYSQPELLSLENATFSPIWS